jgi:hypothetical protein
MLTMISGLNIISLCVLYLNTQTSTKRLQKDCKDLCINFEKCAVRHCSFDLFERFGTVVFVVFGTVFRVFWYLCCSALLFAHLCGSALLFTLFGTVFRCLVRFGTVVYSVRHCKKAACAVRHCCILCSALLFTLFGTVVYSVRHCYSNFSAVRHCCSLCSALLRACMCCSALLFTVFRHCRILCSALLFDVLCYWALELIVWLVLFSKLSLELLMHSNVS